MAPFGSSTTALQAIEGVDCTGKVVLVTGGNSGIGVDTVRALATAGATVILCSRSVEAGEAVAAEIRAAGAPGPITVKQLDLADLRSVKRLGEALDAELDRLNVLILNAGVMACPLSRTAQGFEMQIGVNHIGHTYLTQLLLPKLKASGTPAAPARVVAVSSLAHVFGAIDLGDLNYERRRYWAWPSYGQSKLANVLFAAELARRCEAEGAPLLAYSLHPGNILTTNLQRYVPGARFFEYVEPWLRAVFPLKTPAQGAATTVVAATAEGLPNGCYLDDCKPKAPSARGQDAKMAAALWDKTQALIADALAKA